VLLAAAGQSLRAEQLKVTAVRYWTFEATTRVAIELTNTFEYHVERLHNPERIFFDVPAKLASTGAKPITNVDDKLVRRIRVAETKPGVTRIVLDLTGPAEYTASQLSNPDRLMIELHNGPMPVIPTVSEVSKPAPQMPAPLPVPPPPAPKPAEKPAKTQVASANLPEPPATVLESHKPLQPPTPAETAQAAHRSADGHSSLTRALGLKVTRVVIDPGHGGHDQGTTGPHGLLEKDLVLDVALRLGKLIETNMGSEVI
jgi:N-acetylmuramoyl-L-alanine amidase